MPQMKNSTSSVSGKKNSTSSVSGVENSTSLVSGDAGSNEHGGGIHSDGAVISSFFVNCRVVLLSLLVLAVGLVGGFLLSSKSKTKLMQQYMTLENDLSSVRTEQQLSENKTQLLEQKVLTLENDLSSVRTERQLSESKIQLLEKKVLNLENDMRSERFQRELLGNRIKLVKEKVFTLWELTLPCLNTVMYDTIVVTNWDKIGEPKDPSVDKDLYATLGGKKRREVVEKHVQEIRKHVNFFFIYDDEYINEEEVIILKKFFDFMSDSILNKTLTEKTINQVSDPRSVFCLTPYYHICNYPDVRQSQEFKDTGGNLYKYMNKMANFVKNNACKN